MKSYKTKGVSSLGKKGRVLAWKKVRNREEFGRDWLESSVPSFNMSYIIDSGIKNEDNYVCYIALKLATVSECRLTLREFKSQEKAQTFCQNHFTGMLKKIKKIF